MSTELLTHLRLNGRVLEINTADLTDEDVLRTPETGGNCVAWVLGHVLAARSGMYKALGLESAVDQAVAQRFRRGAAPLTDPADALSLDAFRAQFGATQETLTKTLGELTPERLAQPTPFSPLEMENETIGTLLTFLLFHETYHVGQVGVLRRVLGKPGMIT